MAQRARWRAALSRQMVAAIIRTAFTQETEKAAHAGARAVADRLRARFPKLADLMDECAGVHGLFPRSTGNALECLNGEIKRRINVVAILPNEAVIVRFVGALLLEQTDEWAMQRRYMTLETLDGLSDDPHC